jgi:hypothetical protein
VRRARDERGFVGGFEALPFGFLVFVAGTLLLVNAWAVLDCHLAASAAAREAVRAFVESDGTDAGAREAGEAAAAEAIVGHGKQPSRMTLTWSDAHLARCEPVTATVTYDVPTIAVPWIGAFGGGVLTTTSRHREVVDPYRAGLEVDGFDPEACGA